MNLLLVDADELVDGVCTLDGRRAEHLRSVLGVTVGSKVKAGLVGSGIGHAEVLADDGAKLTLRVTILTKAPPSLYTEVVLAMPRPKALSRVIELLAAFAVPRIDLTNAWRVDKSYLGSARLDAAALAHHARLGAEQGGTTLLPEIHVHDRLMPLLDERFPAPSNALRLIAHPDAPPIESVVGDRIPSVLAIGPEGGWIERELETFVARGFSPVSIGAPILRVENAVAASLGQIVLLRRLGH